MSDASRNERQLEVAPLKFNLSAIPPPELMSEFTRERANQTDHISTNDSEQGKGKGTKPIAFSISTRHFEVNNFPFSYGIPRVSFPPSPSTSTYSNQLSSTDDFTDVSPPSDPLRSLSLNPSMFSPEFYWKRKEKEVAPFLPPLDFSPVDSESFWYSPSMSSSSSSRNCVYLPELENTHLLSTTWRDLTHSNFNNQGGSRRTLSNHSPSSVLSQAALPCDCDFPKSKLYFEPSPYINLDDTSFSSKWTYEDFGFFKHKGRSKSCPTAISPLDYIPASSTDIFVPLPLDVRNLFDSILPQELRLRILSCLVSLHESDHRRVIRDGRWCVGKASSPKGKWVGRAKGVRELVKLSRVSRSWHNLVFDGQLWECIDVGSCSGLPESFLLRLTKISGSFTKHIDFTGLIELFPDTLIRMADNFRHTFHTLTSHTQLVVVNLQGCGSLTTSSLHYLLSRSPFIETLCLKGLSAVTNATCDILSSHCRNLVSLNLSRCANIDAGGIHNWASSTTSRGERLPIKHLWLCGLRDIDDSMMKILGEATPYLEVLDLSYGRQMHNSAIEAFVACNSEAPSFEYSGSRTVSVSPRSLGRESREQFNLTRRVTRIRHLLLSHCSLLTDEACSNLTYSVPDLEFFEIAGIGANLRSEGLVRLLNSTPNICRLDLEDASEITDEVLAVLSPKSVLDPKVPGWDPGHALEYLIISYATNLSDSALLTLIRGRPHMRHLEADNTRIGGAVLREFVQLCEERKLVDATAVVVDCRGVSEPLVKELSASTRPRAGWRSHAARNLLYVDARDHNEDELKVSQDECDETLVVLKSFYSWQMVDAAQAVRNKKRKSNSLAKGKSKSESSRRIMKWWSPNGRSQSETISPLNGIGSNDSCIVA